MKQDVVSGILIDPLGRILLIKRKHDKNILPNYFALPGGKVEPGESLEDAVIREVQEEVGLDFVPETLYREGESEYNFFHRYLGSYSGRILIQEEECDGYGWFHYDEMRALMIHEMTRDIIESLKNDEEIV